MKWTEEKILEFLELFKMEPCLWDPKEPTSKKKSIVDEAWREIIETLSYKVSQHELKRKTAHLLGYYRNHLSKLKKHAKIGLPYATDWFAFDKMDSFLRSVYESTAIKDVSPEPDNSDNDNDTLIDSILNSPTSIINQTFDQQDQFPITNETYEQLLMDNNNRYKRKSSDDGEHIQSSLSISSSGSSCKNNQKKEELDEYDHFACLLATKIRRISSEEDREMLMNSIQNLAFEYYVKNNHKNDSSVQPPTSTVNIIQPINNQCHEFENFLL